MRHSRRAGIVARTLLTLGVLLPYWRLLTFSVVYVTDDTFASDIFNGELPGRVLVGQMVRQGVLPVWTSQLCSGLPLAGAPLDPIGLFAFALLSPGPALDLFVCILLLIAGHGAYGLARRFGADGTSAVLAGLAFAGSGYIACQLKHLAIVATVVWLPVGLNLIDRALDGRTAQSGGRRALAMGAFGLVYAQQVLSGFPQSSYICGLLYCVFAIFRVCVDHARHGGWKKWPLLLGGLGAAALLGAASGAVVLLPLAELGRLSDRAGPLGWEWSTMPAYWLPNILTFLVPYVHGDISNNTYVGPPIFWEDYGYVGLATFLLAIYGGFREWRRPPVAFAIGFTIVAYLLVLGSATPVFRAAYLLLPGLSLFRFPTRFLIVVELGVALLGAIGLTRLGSEAGRRWGPGAARSLAVAVCAITALDLLIHQPRQNPMVPSDVWLAAPRTVSVVHDDSAQPRTFTPRHRLLHRQAFVRARGWTDVSPYFDLRALLEPNLGGGFWNTPSADCYAGATPRWVVDVWGDHNREASLVQPLASVDVEASRLEVLPSLERIMRAYGVTHIISAFPTRGGGLVLVDQQADTYVYRVPGAARVHLVPTARHARNDREAVSLIRSGSVDLNRQVLLHDAQIALPADEATGQVARNDLGSARVTRESVHELVIDAEAVEDGFLVLADTYYPGWTAFVDGRETPILRANVSVRAIVLPKGRHDVRFTFEPTAFKRGLRITSLALASLGLWIAVAAYFTGRARDSATARERPTGR
jgi:Bacterial membrane protein YfhO